jgi:acetyl esterase/lipase
MLLVWGLFCAALAALSLWPPRRHGLLGAAAFFPGWLISELPWHTALGWSGVAMFLAWLAKPLDAADLAGLALVAIAMLALLAHARSVRHTHSSLGEALAAHGLAVEQPAAVGLRRLAAIAPSLPPGVTRLRNLRYGPAGRRNALDIWRPVAASPTPRPALLYVHGGAWVIGDKEMQGLMTVHELAAAGWVCFSMNYRLSPRATYPDQLDDVKAAIAWIRAHGAEYGADPSFLVLAGGSAGAHLASLAALTLAGDPATRVAGCVAYYGVYDLSEDGDSPTADFRRQFLERMVFKRRHRDDPAPFVAASPIAQITPDAPPFFVLHGERDTMVPVDQARRFVARLREVSRAPVTYAELPGAQHAFEIFVSPRSAAAVSAVRRWCQSLAAQRLRAPVEIDVPSD